LFFQVERKNHLPSFLFGYPCAFLYQTLTIQSTMIISTMNISTPMSSDIATAWASYCGVEGHNTTCREVVLRTQRGGRDRRRQWGWGWGVCVFRAGVSGVCVCERGDSGTCSGQREGGQ
jgi:hypothetical protein